VKGIQLAQSRPANTTAVSVYSPDGNEVSHITEILVAETSGSATTYRIFHDDDGTTYDQTTALFYDIAISANTTHIIELNEWMNDEDGNLAVRSGSGNALTFTVTGEILQK